MFSQATDVHNRLYYPIPPPNILIKYLLHNDLTQSSLDKDVQTLMFVYNSLMLISQIQK